MSVILTLAYFYLHLLILEHFKHIYLLSFRFQTTNYAVSRTLKRRGGGRSLKTRKFINNVRWKIMRTRAMSLGAYIWKTDNYWPTKIDYIYFIMFNFKMVMSIL